VHVFIDAIDVAPQVDERGYFLARRFHALPRQLPGLISTAGAESKEKSSNKQRKH
jgi:hypothetical protein